MSYIPKYENDGSGRDTFINYAGAYWLNPLPGGRYYKSAKLHRNQWENSCAESIDPFATQRPPYQSLYGKSRYGTTIMMPNASQTADSTSDDTQGVNADRSRTTTTTTATTTTTTTRRSNKLQPAETTQKDNMNNDNFDAEQTALLRVPYDVAKPEERLIHPGHTMVTVNSTNGCTFTGNDGEEWNEPNQEDCTLLRRAPLYESTCHYGLRTGRYYTADQAPPHDMTLPSKGVSWGKSHYY